MKALPRDQDELNDGDRAVVFEAWNGHVELLTDSGGKDNLEKAVDEACKIETAVNEASRMPGVLQLDDQRATALYLQARANVKLGKWEEAEKKLNELMTIWNTPGKDQDRELPKLLSLQGQVYVGQGKMHEALEVHLKAKNLRVQLFGENHLEVAASLSNISKVYKAQKNFMHAKAALEQAYTIQKERLGKRHKYVADTEEGMGSLLRAMGSGEEAKAFLKKAKGTKKINELEARDLVGKPLSTRSLKPDT